MKQLIFLLIFAFSSQVLALYDFAAINITPEGEQISFCFEYDTRIVDLSQSPFYFADNLYIAAVTQLADILFVKPNPEGGFTISQWLARHDVPAFSQWGDSPDPICLGPFPKTALQDIQLYAGIGNSLEDVIQRNNLVKFFDGFPALPKPEKTWTVMVYMVGSDLEAKSGRKGGQHWATKDILEMREGTVLSSETTNIVITTGGSTRNGWSTVKRALIENGQQYVLEDQGTFDSSQITYSVFDLTHLKSFSDILKNFAIEFKNILEKPSFLNTERLARGIIRAPGYPFRQTGRLRSLDSDHIRIDLYRLLTLILMLGASV